MIKGWNRHVIEVAAIMLNPGRVTDGARRRVGVFFVWYADACRRLIDEPPSAASLFADYRACVPEQMRLDEIDFRRMLRRVGLGTPLELEPGFYADALGSASFEEDR